MRPTALSRRSIKKAIDATMVAVAEGDYVTVPLEEPEADADVPRDRMEAHLVELEEKMREAARRFDFKQAAAYRDRLKELKNRVILDAAT